MLNDLSALWKVVLRFETLHGILILLRRMLLMVFFSRGFLILLILPWKKFNLEYNRSNWEATESNFSFVMWVTLNKVVPPFQSLDQILKCDQAKAGKQSSPVLLFVTMGEKWIFAYFEPAYKFMFLCDIIPRWTLLSGGLHFCLDIDKSWTTYFIYSYPRWKE